MGIRSQDTLAAALVALWLFDSGRSYVETVATSVALWLVSVGRVLRLMAKLLLFRESFPLALDLRWLILPLLADDLGDFWI